MNTRKSQAAMEFLMTYGWALLVVIIVIAALAFFGLLNPSKFLPERCDLGAGLTCMDFNAKTNDSAESIYDSSSDTSKLKDTITLLVNNGLGTPIYNVHLNITLCGNGTDSGAEGIGTIGHKLNETALTVTVSAMPEATTQKFVVSCGGMVANSRFKSDVILNYSTITEGQTLTHAKKGSVNMMVQYVS